MWQLLLINLFLRELRAQYQPPEKRSSIEKSSYAVLFNGRNCPGLICLYLNPNYVAIES